MPQLFATVTMIVVLLLGVGCDLLLKAPLEPSEQVNPRDPDNSGFIFPSTHLVSGPESSWIVSSDSVTFCVRGNLDTMQFQFRLDSEDRDAWSAWTPYQDQAYTTLTYLSEGQHTFEARAGYSETVYDTLGLSRTFTVEAFSNTLRFMPSDLTSTEGDQVQLVLEVDTIVDLMAVRAAIIFNPLSVHLDSVVATSASGDVYFFESRGESWLLPTKIDNTAGTVDFNAAVSGADSTGLAASGTLARIYLTCLQSGTTELILSPTKTVLIDVANNSRVPERLGRARIIIRSP